MWNVWKNILHLEQCLRSSESSTADIELFSRIKLLCCYNGFPSSGIQRAMYAISATTGYLEYQDFSKMSVGTDAMQNEAHIFLNIPKTHLNKYIPVLCD